MSVGGGGSVRFCRLATGAFAWGWGGGVAPSGVWWLLPLGFCAVWCGGLG